MRCPDVVLSAMVSHPIYRETPGLLDRAGEVFSKFPLWALARYLPPAEARRMLMACLPEIRRMQSPSGLWKRKFSELRSCTILLALKHAGLFESGMDRRLLAYNPFLPFAHAETLHGLLVRRHVMDTPLSTDAALQQTLADAITSAQTTDGAWDGMVAMTANRLELLLDLGIDPTSPVLQRGATWILDQYKESVHGHRGGNQVAAQAVSMFTTTQQSEEFSRFDAAFPEEDVCGACFYSLPLIQTGLAIRALIRLGHADDPRVDASCRSLLAMQRPDITWCAIGCRHILERRLVEERKAERI